MIRVLPNVLTAAELQAVRELLPQVRFGDGRVTNPDSSVKQNLQAPQEDPANARIAQIAREALVRYADVRTFAQPRSMARTTVVRYEPGMNYGWHVDEAMFGGIILSAATDAQISVVVVEKRMQGRDHPVLLSVPETYYLKCFVLRRAA